MSNVLELPGIEQAPLGVFATAHLRLLQESRPSLMIGKSRYQREGDGVHRAIWAWLSGLNTRKQRRGFSNHISVRQDPTVLPGYLPIDYPPFTA
jgi:hypothetical protein